MPITLAGLVRERLGVDAFPRVNPEVSSIGTSVVTVFSNNPNRVAWLIVNMSLNRVFVSWLRAVSATAGIWIDPNGGTVSALWDEDFDAVGWELHGIADGAASAVYTVEWLTAKGAALGAR